MDTPDPHHIGHRKRFEAFERNITGGHHIGHLPVYVHKIEGWIFRRCRCGFSLVLTPSGAIWWLRTTKGAMAINSFKALLHALSSNCWAHPGPSYRRMLLFWHLQLQKSQQNPAMSPLQIMQSVSDLAQPH